MIISACCLADIVSVAAADAVGGVLGADEVGEGEGVFGGVGGETVAADAFEG